MSAILSSLTKGFSNRVLLFSVWQGCSFGERGLEFVDGGMDAVVCRGLAVEALPSIERGDLLQQTKFCVMQTCLYIRRERGRDF